MSEDYVVVNSILSYRIRYVMHKDDLQKLNPDKPCKPIEWQKILLPVKSVMSFLQNI